MATLQELQQWVKAKPGRSANVKIENLDKWLSREGEYSENVYLYDSTASAGALFHDVDAIELNAVNLEYEAVKQAQKDIERAQRVIENARKVVNTDGLQNDESTDRGHDKP